MLWVAVFALVCMAAVGVALLGITLYLLYSLGRHLFHGATVLLRVGRQKPKLEPVVEPPQPVADV